MANAKTLPGGEGAGWGLEDGQGFSSLGDALGGFVCLAWKYLHVAREYLMWVCEAGPAGD